MGQDNEILDNRRLSNALNALPEKDVDENFGKKNCNYPRKLSRKSTSIKVEPSVPRIKGKFLRWYGWGYTDSGFTRRDGITRFIGDRYPISGKELPFLGEYIKEKYDLEIEESYDTVEISLPEENYPQSKFKDETLQKIEDLGIEVSCDGVQRFTRCRGQSFEDVWKLRQKDMSRIPDAVAWPTCHEEVVELVKLAGEENFVIIPYGGGTSVARALECPANEFRPILSIDTHEMNEILWVDRKNLTICAESGIIGKDLEKAINELGYTTGHEPDSIEFSTLGGWVSTRASGMKKNLYGNMEDLMVHARLVTPIGVLDKKTKAPRMSCGPDFNHIILGSEGSFGVITEVVLKIRPLPECQVFDSIVFPDFETGIDFMREIAIRRWQPASIRLMDEEQFQIGWSLRPKNSFLETLVESLKFKYLELVKGFDFKKICLCTIVHEGRKDEVYHHLRKVTSLAAEKGGVVSGATIGKRGYMMTYVVAYIRDIAIEFGVVAESMETALPWDTVYEASIKIREVVTTECQKMGSRKSLTMMRIAQTYDVGCCLYVYFSFSVLPGLNCLELCTRVNKRIKAIALQYGGSLSHHHGIGKMKKKWYPNFISDPGVSALKGIKQQLDPNNVFGARNLIEDYYASEKNTSKPLIM